MSEGPKRRAATVAATLAAAGLLAAACGGGGAATPGASTSIGAGTTRLPTATSGAQVPATTAPASTPATTEMPRRGGRLVFALESDTGSPWRPFEMLCASSCYQVASAVYDTLTVNVRQAPGWKPYLARRVVPNATFTSWTVTARPGVKFHDGTPFDGAAIADNLNRAKGGFLTGTSLADVASIAVSPTDPMAVVVVTKRPWATFPIYLSSQLGMMASPTWLKASDGDQALRSKPVGTGPFIFESYAPNGSFKAKRNPNYWYRPYPYLDEVEFRPIADGSQRADALKSSGVVDMIHTTNGQTIKSYEGSSNPVLEIRDYKGSTVYALLHVSPSATGRPSPLADQRVRCALANAVDTPALVKTLQAGVNRLADGPFSPEQVGYLADTGYPQHQDMAKAQALIAAYKRDHPGPLVLSLATTNDETNLTVAQFQKQWYEEAGVDRVSIDQIDQAAFILAALKGDFQTFQWRNHSGVDLDSQYIWWHSSTAVPDGQLGLNYGRIRDPVIDKALDDNRSTTDPTRKKLDAETINRRFAEQCYDLWGWWTAWAIVHDAAFHIPADDTLPDGSTTGPTNEIVNIREVWKS